MPRYRARYFGEIPGPMPHSVIRIAAGEEFDYEGKPGLWMEPVVASDKGKVPQEDKTPDTLHGIAKQNFENSQEQFRKAAGEPMKRGPGRPPKYVPVQS